MRCYSNGAQFLDRVVGRNPDWPKLEAAARAVPPGCGGVTVSPFVLSEPSIGVTAPRFGWSPNEPTDPGVRVRASFEALAYLIGLAVKEHEAAGQSITRITVSGGIARSDLMGEILASVLNRPLSRLVSAEGPALGAAAAALAGLESHRRKQASASEPFGVADAVAALVKYRTPVEPRADWVATYRDGLSQFAKSVQAG
jgi:sugar (pentulose or hexulose) kinase